MADEATTPLPNPDGLDTDTLETLQAKGTQVFQEEHQKYAENLARLQTGGDDVTKQLLTEIVERLAMLSRQVDMEYTEYFPLHFYDAMLGPVWTNDKESIIHFLTQGGAKAALDERYFELEGDTADDDEE